MQKLLFIEAGFIFRPPPETPKLSQCNYFDNVKYIPLHN